MSIRWACGVLAILGGTLLAAAAGAQKEKLDPASEAFYREARLIMTGEENKIFRHLTDAESRKEFIQDFWDKRDPNPDTPDNEFKIEFENRVAYANKRFHEGGPGMNTERGRIWIFLGPPDKTEEFQPSPNNPAIRGSIIQWVYYRYAVGIEFVDEKGNGVYRMRDHEGNIFEAMDLFKVGGMLGADSVFKTNAVKFELRYDEAARELEVSLPAKSVIPRENGEGKLELDLEFKFYIYEGESTKRDVYTEAKSYVTTERELEGLKTIPFRFARPLTPGLHIVDVIIKGQAANSGKLRKIFDIKVKS